MRPTGTGTQPAASLAASLNAVLRDPSPAGLWALQKSLLAAGGNEAGRAGGNEAGRAGRDDAGRARGVARAFHACLRTLESKAASRTASRWGATLGTAAVGAISLPELRDRQVRGITELVERALPAFLEIGAALQSAQAWEIEAGLIYDEFAWFLYEELWDLSKTTTPELPVGERHARVERVLEPLLDSTVSDGDRAALLVDVFRSVLAARVVPLLGPDGRAPGPGTTA